jgi:hypothetical protein
MDETGWRRWLPRDVIDWILIAIMLLSINQLLSLLGPR